MDTTKTPIKRAFTYSRVNPKEADAGYSTDFIEAILHVYARRLNHKIVDGGSEYGFKESLDGRPAIEKIISLARKQKIDIVIVAYIKDISEDVQVILKFINELATYNVRIESIFDAVDYVHDSPSTVLQGMGGTRKLLARIIHEAHVHYDGLVADNNRLLNL